MSIKQFVKEVIELIYGSCRRYVQEYMNKLDYEVIDMIYKDIKDDLSIELD